MLAKFCKWLLHRIVFKFNKGIPFHRNSSTAEKWRSHYYFLLYKLECFMGILQLFRKIVSPYVKNYDNFSSCTTRCPTRSLRSLARYRVEYSKRNFVSSRAYWFTCIILCLVGKDVCACVMCRCSKTVWSKLRELRQLKKRPRRLVSAKSRPDLHELAKFIVDFLIVLTLIKRCLNLYYMAKKNKNNPFKFKWLVIGFLPLC